MALTEARIELDLSCPAAPASVAAIRRAVNDAATGCGADRELLLRIGLAVTEAATNVVLHAYRTPSDEPASIHVTAGVEGGALHVCVRDRGVGMSPRADSPGLGLGLSLMAHEADRFETRERAGGGTEVLLCFALGAAPSAAGSASPFPRRDAAAARANA